MEISTQDLAREVAGVGVFEGRDVAGLSRAELDLFLGGALAALNAVKVVAAVASAEMRRRDEADRDASGRSRRAGHASTRSRIAGVSGGSEAEAQCLIEVGQTLVNAASPPPPDSSTASSSSSSPSSSGAGAVPVWPLVAEGVRAGRLSAEKAAVIVHALEALAPHALPGLEAELVGKGERLSLRDLRRAVDATIAVVNRRELAVKQQRQCEQRFVKVWEGRDGLTHLQGVLDPETAAPVKAFMEAYVRDQFAARRDQNPVDADRRTPGQMNADALSVMATHLLGCEQPVVKSTAMVVVRADYKELAADLGVGDCDQLQTPLAGEGLRRLACGARVLPVLTDGKSLPLDYGRTRGPFTLEQRLAMLERDGGCAKCHAPASWCDAHHVVERQHGGRTDLGNGAMLCVRCHHDVHRDGWKITFRRVTGPEGKPEDQIWFTPPATIDPDRKPFLGGKAALRLNQVRRDPLPHEHEPADDEPADPHHGENAAPSHDQDPRESSDHDAPPRRDVA